jgi:hypothetical protein
MKSAPVSFILLFFVTISALSAPLTAQTADAPKATASATLKVALVHGIDAMNAKVGDPVLARCTSAFMSRGELRIPKNAKVIGHITEVQRKTVASSESTLGIIFDRALMRDGRELSLTATIQAIAAPSVTADESDEASMGDSSSPESGSRSPEGGASVTSQPATATAEALPGQLHVVSASTAPGNSHSATNATGVIGLKGLELDTAASSTGDSVIRSSSQNVRLESGTRLTLRVSLQ